MRRSGIRANGRRINTVERQREAIELRKQGLSFSAIADQLGFKGPSGAHAAVMAALRDTVQEPADELRVLECERLDQIFYAMFPHMVSGSPRHAEMCIKVMDRRAALLGLDAPKKVEDHHRVTVEVMASQLSEQTGLDKEEILAEAEAILRQAAETNAA